jgi:hypothetical protein
MAITFVNTAKAAATSLTLPAHQAGDLILIAAFTTGSTIPIPSGVEGLKQVGTTGRRMSVGYITADSASEVSGTWTNAELMIASAYRSDAGKYIKVATQNNSNGSSTSISYLTLITPFSLSPNAWAVAFCGTTIDAAANTAPALMTNRDFLVATGEIAVHDTNANVTTWATTNVATASTGWVTFTCEINETDIAIPTGSGGVPLIGPGGLVY